jgi:hypothetical protein
MSKVKWKKLSYGRGIYTHNSDGDMITIEPSDDQKGMWTSGGRYSSRLGDLKATITQEIESGGSGYRRGGAVMKSRGGTFKGTF